MEPNEIFKTKSCGEILSTTADGAFHGNTMPDETVLDDTELTDAPKGVIVLVPHGVCGISGVTTTIMKKGVNEEGPNTNTNSNITPPLGHSVPFEI